MKTPQVKYPASRVQRTSRGLMHCIAECKSCAWRDEHYVGAARAATRHCRETGHEVMVDQGIIYTVRIRKEPKP